MSRLRQELTAQLTAKVERFGVVVWSDPDREYGQVAAELLPEGTTFERLDGSWYELRRRIEPELGRLDPRLVIYVDVDEPEEDPLAEARTSGTRFTRQLATLLRQVMASELAASKLEEIAKAATTLVEAESLLEGGMGGGPALLVKRLGPHEPTELILRLATNAEEILATHPDVIDEAVQFLDSHLGVGRVEPDDVSGAIARHLVLVELEVRLGTVPKGLGRAHQPVSGEQRRRCEAVLHRWMHDRRLLESFERYMERAGTELAIAAQLGWREELADLDTVPDFDELAFQEYLDRMQAGAFAKAEMLAAARLQSRWVIRDGAQELAQWRAAHGAAQLQRIIGATKEPRGATVGERLRHYAEHDWEIDRAHRRLELALLALTARVPLEDVVQGARRAYDAWLDGYLRRFTDGAEREGLAPDGLLLQSHVHADVVAPRAQHSPVAYFMVDALRYELAYDLVDALRRQYQDGSIELRAAVGLIPSITPVGMANLCPGAEKGLALSLDSADRLVVRIEGQDVMNPQDRVGRLRGAHGKVADLRLDDLVRLTERELADQIEGVALVLVRSQEIDEQGETGKLNVGLSGFEATVQHLSRAVARLANNGIAQFVISADHGFLALTREVGAHMIIPKPGGRGEVHRRAFIGRGGTSGEALLRLPLNRVGLPGDLDVVVPRGVALIAAGGARGFFHGGLSPQEILVPVITVDVKPSKGSTLLVVDADIASRITSQVFTGKMLLPPSLLSDPLVVRPVPVRVSDGRDVGVLAAAGDAEESEGLVRLEAGEEVTLGFRLTSSLKKGDKIEVHVYDARTDRRLGVSQRQATVARDLEVDDELS